MLHATGPNNLYLGLVCLPTGEICCASYEEFSDILKARQEDGMDVEASLPLYVYREVQHSFRIRAKEASSHDILISKTINMNDYPGRLFE